MRFLIFAALSVGPASPALAQDAIVDPGPDTPAGTQYQIPVDTARQDAAPHPTAPKRHNGTTLQSENGFGSSSVVPGAAAAPVRPATVVVAKQTPRVRHRRQPRAKPHPVKQRTTAKPKPTTPVVAPSQPAPVPQQVSATPPSGNRDGNSGLILLLGSVAVAGTAGSVARRR